MEGVAGCMFVACGILQSCVVGECAGGATSWMPRCQSRPGALRILALSQTKSLPWTGPSFGTAPTLPLDAFASTQQGVGAGVLSSLLLAVRSPV